MAGINIIEKQKEELTKRKDELEPVIKEYDEIEQALAALTGESPSRARRTSSTAPRAARGQRREEFLHAITSAEDGITVAEATREIEVASPYGYKLKEELIREGLIEAREGTNKLYPTGKAPKSPEMSAEPSKAKK